MSAAPTALAEVQDICSLPLMDVPYRPPGKWDDEAYLTLVESVRRLVEMTDGVVEVLPPPTIEHQHMLGWLFEAFRRRIARAGGKVIFSPVPLRIRERNYREPDLIFWRNSNEPRLEGIYLDGADLVVEVVSPSEAPPPTALRGKAECPPSRTRLPSDPQAFRPTLRRHFAYRRR